MTTSALHASFDGLLLDLDGVVYVGPDAVPHAADALALARAEGARCMFVTNNASRTASAVAAHLSDVGIPAGPDDVVTSPQAAVTVLAGMVRPGARVLVIGGAGIEDVLTERGFTPVRSLAQEPEAIMQGFSPDLGWRDLALATTAARSGLPWIATNPDLTFPTPDGPAPGNGALVRLVAGAAGREPNAVAGKPEPPLLEEAMRRLNCERPLMIGDRLDTDVEAGSRIGIPTLLVMTGVTTASDVMAAAPSERPTFLGRDLRVLTEPYPSVTLEWGLDPQGPSHQGEVPLRARCRDRLVSWGDSGPVLDSADGAVGGAVEDAVDDAVDDMDVLRAACALAWARADAGTVAIEVAGHPMAVPATNTTGA